MSKCKFYDCYDNPPPKVYTDLDTSEVFVSQSEVKVSGLAYQLKQYGMDTLSAQMETLRSKFGYADCRHINDFATLQNKYVEAVDYFNALPSDIRRQYQDRPELFYEDVQKNPDTAFKGGFISEEFYKQLNEKLKNTSSNQIHLTQEVATSSTSESSGQPQQSLD